MCSNLSATVLTEAGQFSFSFSPSPGPKEPIFQWPALTTMISSSSKALENFTYHVHFMLSTLHLHPCKLFIGSGIGNMWYKGFENPRHFNRPPSPAHWETHQHTFIPVSVTHWKGLTFRQFLLTLVQLFFKSYSLQFNALTL